MTRRDAVFGDGTVDLIVIVRHRATVEVLASAGHGTFAAAATYPVDGDPRAAAVADTGSDLPGGRDRHRDTDGRADLAVVGADGAVVLRSTAC